MTLHFQEYKGRRISTDEEEIRLYLDMRKELIERGYEKEIEWSENIKSCKSKHEFFAEYIFVVINSGMKAQIARKIYEKVLASLINGVDINTVFGHKGKCKAINYVKDNLDQIWNWGFEDNIPSIEYLERLPYIGKITKYHLAKNLGMDVCKPDRHLIRIAKGYGLTPMELCNKIASRTGDKVATIDTVLWRSANLGLI